jgi:hypothetical protein
MLSEICAGKTVLALAGTKEQVYVGLKLNILKEMSQGSMGILNRPV